ncbi:hypothetical protein D3C87_1432470 [compost metagenome]
MKILKTLNRNEMRSVKGGTDCPPDTMLCNGVCIATELAVNCGDPSGGGDGEGKLWCHCMYDGNPVSSINTNLPCTNMSINVNACPDMLCSPGTYLDATCNY